MSHIVAYVALLPIWRLFLAGKQFTDEQKIARDVERVLDRKRHNLILRKAFTSKDLNPLAHVAVVVREVAEHIGECLVMDAEEGLVSSLKVEEQRGIEGR